MFLSSFHLVCSEFSVLIHLLTGGNTDPGRKGDAVADHSNISGFFPDNRAGADNRVLCDDGPADHGSAPDHASGHDHAVLNVGALLNGHAGENDAR